MAYTSVVALNYSNITAHLFERSYKVETGR